MSEIEQLPYVPPKEAALEMISASELAIVTGKSRQWICELCRSKRIPAIKRGNMWLVDPMVKLPPDARVVSKEVKEARRQHLREMRAKYGADVVNDILRPKPQPKPVI